MKIRGTDFVFYNTTDMERSKKFYGETLGLKLIGEPSENWAEYDTGNVVIGIGKYGAKSLPKDQTGNVSLALAVDNVKDSIEYLRGKGVVVKMEMQDFKSCSMAMFTDPDGNELMLHQRKDGTVG
jgi:predicted enzyme related to lactoylglutathione lyase